MVFGKAFNSISFCLFMQALDFRYLSTSVKRTLYILIFDICSDDGI